MYISESATMNNVCSVSKMTRFGSDMILPYQ